MDGNVHWYAVSTRSRSEKKVAQKLREKSVEVFLPLVKTLRQWSDRKKMVEIPLINCYVFVRIDYKDHVTVLQTPGVVRFLTFQKQPARVTDREILNLRIMLENSANLNTQEATLEIGEYIEINTGPFAGYKGEIVRKKSNNILVVRLDFMSTIISVEISSKFL
jgi:transcription antitermination factor NusG